MHDPEVQSAIEYLSTGGLGEVVGITQMAMDTGQPKVQSDTPMAMALCVLAQEALNARVTRRMLKPMATDPELLELIKKSKDHVMTPEEEARQRYSWTLGELMLSHPEMTREEAISLVNEVLSPPRKFRIYIAAKYHRGIELQTLAGRLKEAGHAVTSRWLYGGEETLNALSAAQMDIDDVDQAEVLLFIGEPQGSKNTGGGRWFELGRAHATGKRCMVVLGEFPVESYKSLGVADRGHETVFTSLPGIETYRTLDDALKAL